MKNILTILLLTLTVSCFGQTYGWMISKDPAQNADTANVLVMFPTGHANLTGRGHFISYETFAALIEPYISGGGVTDGDKGDITVSGTGATWSIDNNAVGAPELLSSGVIAGSYSHALFTVDADGRITSATGGSPQLLQNTSDATSHTQTLTGGGGTSTQYIEGTGINLATGGTLGQGTVTISTTAILPSDTSSMLSNYISRSDTASMLSPYLREQGYYWIDRHGAIADDGINDRDSIQALLDYVESIGGGVVVVPIGVFNITYNAIREGIYIGDNTTLLGFGSGSEIRYTGHPTNSSNAIQNRRSSGQYSDFQQRTGNVNIHIQGIKLSFTERDDFKNIGINLSGVTWGSVTDTWVDSCGGYSVLIGRTNDTDTIGNRSENINISNLKITNMMDVGLEIWGCKNVTAKNLNITGRGTDTGYGIGVNVWNGASNILISNASIEKDTNDYDAIDRHMVAFNVDGFALGDTIFGFRKTENVTFENINSRTDIGFRINRINDVVDEHRVDSVYIRNCNFLGYDTIRDAADIRHCRTLFIEGCTFDRFAKQLQFSGTGATSFQNSVSDVTIRNNSFTWGEGIDFYGITDFNIYDNQFYYIFDQAPITVRGGRNGLIKNNYFLDIGNGSDQWCITLNKLTASVTRDTRLIEVTGNTACDDRASKNTDDLVTMYDATDSITVKFNVLDCADTDADQYSNIGTGTHIFTTELGLQDHDWYEEGTTRAPNAIGDNIFTEAPQVGMGTNAPETNLHVQGVGLVVARVESTAGQAQVNIKGTSFGQIENTAGHLYVTNAASGSDLILRTDGSTEKLRLSPTAATFADDCNVPDEAYNATSWNGSTEVPTKNAIRDKVESFAYVAIADTASMLSHYIERQDTASMLSHYIERQDTASMLSKYIDRASAETIYGVKTFNADPIVPAEAYAVGWNGSNEPPTKNDVYDKIETLGASSGHTIRDDGVDETARTGLNFVSTSTINMVGTDDLANNETEIAANVIAGSIGDTELGSGLDATQLADGTVTSTELQYINTLSSNAQTQLNGKFTLAGASGGQTAIGGTGTTDDLILQSTSGVGATGALIQMKVGNNGGTTAATILNNGNFGIGTTNPGYLFEVQSATPVTSINDTDGTNRCFQGAYFQSSGTDYYSVAINRDPATGTFANTGRAASQINFESNISNADIAFYTHTSNNVVPSERLRIKGSGKTGLATTAPDALLEINLGTADALRLTYNDNNGSAANYMDATISSTGSPTFNATGTTPTFTFSDPVLFDGYARLKAYTVATLPTGVTGAMAYVTDATAPTYLGALTGGGAVVCPVFYNGSAWVSH